MFERSSRVVVGLVVAFAGMVSANRAHALIYDNPYGDEAVSVVIGYAAGFNTVSVRNLATGECTARTIRDPYFEFWSGAGHDVIWVVGSGTISHCGWTLGPVRHMTNGFYYLSGGEGDDLMQGDKSTLVDGDGGQDAVITLQNGNGYAGNDIVFGNNERSRITGGSGSDRMCQIFGSKVAYVNGDSGSDTFFGTATEKYSVTQLPSNDTTCSTLYALTVWAASSTWW